MNLLLRRSKLKGVTIVPVFGTSGRNKMQPGS